MDTLENILTFQLVQKLGWTLLHFIWQAAAVVLLLAILLRILRRFSANLRYVTACLALVLIVLLPVFTMPFISVPPSQKEQPEFRISNTESRPQAAELQPSVISPPASVIYEPIRQEPARKNYFAALKQRAADILEPALPHIVTGWLLGVFALSIWHLGGWAQLQKLRKKMVKQVDTSLKSKLNQLSKKLGVTQAVDLLESALVQIPTVVGWIKPIILLPASALTGLNSEQLEAILAHELAHIKRLDYLVNMLQTVVEILGFYHPAVWWISHKIRAERENCCDDLAIAVTGDRVRYARALTSMEEIRGRNSELAVAATGGNLFSRIRRLIGKDSSEKTFSWIPAAAVILLLIALLIPAAIAITSASETKQPDNQSSNTEKTDSNTKILIETQIIHVSDDFLKQVGLDADSLKNSNSWKQYRVDDSSSPTMFVIDSHTKEMLLKNVDESKDSSSISRIYLMTISGREAMIKNYSGYDFKSQELGRFIKIKPELSQDGRSTSLDCELMIRRFENFEMFYDVYINKKVDQNAVPESEIVEYKVNAENAQLSDDHTLLILGGKLVSLRDVEKRQPILRHIPVTGEFINTTSRIEGQANEIILIKTTIVPAEQSDDVDSKASSYNLAKIEELVRMYLDLDLEESQYIEIKDIGKRKIILKQVTADSIGKGRGDFPAYASYIDFEIRSNFDLNLSTQRLTRGTLFEHDKWDAYFTGPDTITGNGYYTPTILCVCAWGLKIWSQSPSDPVDETKVSLVAVKIKPDNEKSIKWGEAVDGLQYRLKPEQLAWKQGQPLRFSLDIRNSSPKSIRVHTDDLEVDLWLEIDGVIYFKNILGLDNIGTVFLPPGDILIGTSFVVSESRDYNSSESLKEPRQALKLTPGKHTVRIARSRNSLDLPPVLFSNPLEIEILPETDVSKSIQWGEIQNGLMCGLIQPAFTLNLEENPYLALVLSNEGQTQYSFTPLSEMHCEVEVDGQWYGWAESMPDQVEVLSLKDKGCIRINLSDSWALPKEPNQLQYRPGVEEFWGDRLKVSPGKHTFRVKFRPLEWLEGYQKGHEDLFVISDPVEIEFLLSGNQSAVQGDAKQAQLNKILEKYSKGATADVNDENIQSACESVEKYIAAALAGEDEKAAVYADPESAVARQTDDTRQVFKGQPAQILAVCSSEWNALAISSVIQADHGRKGTVVFHLKKEILDQKVHWLIDDIDIETLDSIETEIKRFLERNPQAKTILFKPPRPIIAPASSTGDNPDEQVGTEQEKPIGRRMDNSTFFNQPVTRNINSTLEQKDCFIDFDNNKLFSPSADFDSFNDEQQKAWKQENGIDASGSTSEGGEGLWGEKMVVIPVANEEFTRMNPSSFRNLLQQATPASPAVMTAIGELPKTYVFKTREGGMGLLQILEVQNKQKPNYIKIRYKMVPRTTESELRIISDKKIRDLGKVMVLYCTRHQGTLPNSLQDFALFMPDNLDIDWLSKHIEYLGKGKTENERPDTIIAYDRSLLQSQQGTNVLFLDGHVEFVEAEKIKELVHEEIIENPQEPSAGTLANRVYDITDLVSVGARLSGGTGDGTMGGDRDTMGGMGSHVNIPDQAFANEAQKIINQMIQTIDPNSWNVNNPDAKGAIIPYPAERPRKLAIYQSVQVHQKIEKFIESRREQIDTTQISIELRIIHASENFPEEVGKKLNLKLDPNTPLDDLQLESLLKAAQADKGTKMLAAPKVVVLDNEPAQLSFHQALPYVTGYTEPNIPGQEPLQKIEYKTIGTFCDLTPHMTADRQNVYLDFKLDISQLTGYEERIYQGKYKEQVPQFETNTIASNKNIPDGKTLFLDGGPITIYEKKEATSAETTTDSSERIPEKKRLIILIKPTILPPEQTEQLGLERTPPPAMMGIYGYGYVEGDPPPGFGGMGGSSYGTPPPEIQKQQSTGKQATRVYDITDLAGTTEDVNDLINKIKKTIEPDSWYDNNNKALGTIYAFPAQQPKKLAIYQNVQIHQKIQKFLNSMRSSSGEEFIRPPEPTFSKNFEEIKKQAESENNSNIGMRVWRGSYYIDTLVGTWDSNNSDAEVVEATEQLIKLIIKNVEPDSWFKLNPKAKGIIQPNSLERPYSLAITNTGKAHHYIQKLFDLLRALSDKGINPINENLNYSQYLYQNQQQAEPSVIKPNEPELINHILIQAGIIMVNDKFLKNIGLDDKSSAGSSPWSKYRIADSNDLPGFIIDPNNTDMLIKTIESRDGCEILSRPQVIAINGKSARMLLLQVDYDSSHRPKTRFIPLDRGSFIKMIPQLTKDNKSIWLDCEFEWRQLQDIKQLKYKNEYEYDYSEVKPIKNIFRTLVPDDQTLLILGPKIISLTEHQISAPLLGKVPLSGGTLRGTSKIAEEGWSLLLIKPIFIPFPFDSNNKDLITELENKKLPL